MSRIDCPAISRKHFAKLRQVEGVPLRAEWLQILFRKPEQPTRRAEPLPVLRMRRMLELLLEMDERPRGLDQALEILRILRADRVVQPNLLENIMRFIVTLFVPALKEGSIVGMVRHQSAAGPGAASLQRLHETRNPLAFAHEGLNLGAPAMMGKRRHWSRRASAPEEHPSGVVRQTAWGQAVSRK